MHHVKKHHAQKFAKQLLQHHLAQPDDKKIKLDGGGAETLQALFLGTHGGNAPIMKGLLELALQGNVVYRKSYFPNDPDYLDEEIQNSLGFAETSELLFLEYLKLIEQLQQSGTFFSMRTIGHMLWDTTMPGMLGYFAALLYNQNNVAAEASPVTTLLEMEVGNELCKLLGYNVHPIGADVSTIPQDLITGWGHITCDGSVANLEALWMARNLKYYAVSVRAALQNAPVLQPARNFQVTLLNGTQATLTTLDDWTTMNLPIDEVLSLADNISKQYNIDPEVLSNTILSYTVQYIGFHDIQTIYTPTITHTPVSMCAGTRHYSWPKAAAVLGIGQGNMINIGVDLNARMDVSLLEAQLNDMLAQKIPVMNVVVIIGTTEESSVDPLTDILTLRQSFRAKGMEFAIHCDAAWGGYFKSMLYGGTQTNPHKFETNTEEAMAALPMSAYVLQQYKALQFADSITIDPHKSGYVPYPAGGLCYRNSAMRNLVSFTAPVVYHGGVDPTVGVYGIEGSKPGAAAAAVYLSHRVIRPNMDGYGKLSGECFFNAKRLYAALVCLNIQDLPFFVVPLIPIPAIQQGLPEDQIQKQYEFIRDRIVNVTNEQLIADTEAYALFKELGGDQTIVTYLYNYYSSPGVPNTSMAQVNVFNTNIYERFSFRPGEKNIETTPIVVTSSTWTRAIDGDALIDGIRSRLGVTGEDDADIDFIISTIMNPFLSNTVQGSFIPQLISIIVENVTDCITQVHAGVEKELATV